MRYLTLPSGVGGIIGSAVSSIITPILSDWLAGVIGDATGYGHR